MYYGKGAGKLPTASAVVADVVDCAKHPGKHIICLWEEEKIPLLDFSQSMSRFFVRAGISGRQSAKELFPVEKELSLSQYPGEFAFVTAPMSEREFAEQSMKLKQLITRIRIKD